MDELAAQAFRRHYRQIYGFVRRRSAADSDAEDIAAEVFADAADALERFEPGSTPVLAWLYTVARRRLADEARRRARACPVIHAVVDTAGTTRSSTCRPASRRRGCTASSTGSTRSARLCTRGSSRTACSSRRSSRLRRRGVQSRPVRERAGLHARARACSGRIRDAVPGLAEGRNCFTGRDGDRRRSEGDAALVRRVSYRAPGRSSRRRDV